ncbi:MAG: DUF1292 domain-containing protein [Lachnospiraceae bacterium]|nr:DUF1292 domain-containing protein [Lachnospiraceae bacterium]
MAEEYSRMILEDADGNEQAFLPVLSFAMNDKEYFVLQPDKPGGEEELVIFGFHAGENDELILDDIEDDEEYALASEQAERLLNGDGLMEEYIVDDGNFTDEQKEALEKLQNGEADLEDDEEDFDDDEDAYYEDEEGRLFILAEDGHRVYVDENGDPLEDVFPPES